MYLRSGMLRDMVPITFPYRTGFGAAGGVETATRVLDRLSVGAGHTVLVQGAAGGTGTIVVQMAVARGGIVIGTASEHNHDFLRFLVAEPTTYGPGLVERIRALAPAGVDAVIDCAGGALPDLIAIAGGTAHVVTIADFNAAPTERKPPCSRKDCPGALTGRSWPARYPARAGGLWLRSTLDLSRFHAIVVPSGYRTRVQPIRWIIT